MIAIYCRISGKKEKDKDTSIQTQQQLGVAFANSMKMSYRFFIDKGISGTKVEIRDRPEFAEMIASIDKKEISAVFCIDQSRIERNAMIWQLFQFTLCKNNCSYYPAGIFTDLEDPMTKMLTGIVSLSNELYASLTSKKVKLAFTARAIKGKTHGLIAYGYEKDKDGYYKINEVQAEVVKRIYQFSCDGIGTYSIANKLNEEGIATKYNGFSGVIKRRDEFTNKEIVFKKENVRWRGNVIHDMIINPLYKGIRKWNENEIQVPSIVDAELWEKVNKHLQVNKKNAGKHAEYHYLLNGLVYCEGCGCGFRGKYKKIDKDSAYKCAGKSRNESKCSESRAISICKLETFIIHHLFVDRELETYLLALPASTEPTNLLKVKMVKHESQLKQLERKIDKLRNLLIDPELETDEALKQAYITAKRNSENVKSSIDIIQNQIFEAENNIAKTRLTNSIGEYEITASFEATKKLVHALIEKITIKHTNAGGGGVFLVGIEYKGFEESSLFLTQHKAMKWVCLSTYRKFAMTKEQLKDDKSLLKSLAGDKVIQSQEMREFKGFETRGSEFSTIELKPEQLIHYN